MAGYTRNDTANNIADGNIINASDLDGEFDAIQTAFGTSGHTHDGTAGNGPKIATAGLANSAVSTVKLADDAVTGAKLDQTESFEMAGLTLTGALDFNSVTGRAITITGDSGLDSADASIYLGNIGDNTGYGWDLEYQGSGSGNDNKFRLVSTNQGDAKVAFSATQDGIVKFEEGVNFPDSKKAQFGAGNDLQIYHNGSNSYVADEGTGDLIISGSTNVKIRSNGGEDMGVFTKNGAATLYYDNAPKIATTSTGIDVTGRLTTDGLTTSKAIVSDVNTVNATGATTTVNMLDSNFHIINMQADTTFSFSNLSSVISSSGTLVIKQDATGGRDFTLPSVCKTPVGGASIVQYTSANSTSILTYLVVSSTEVLVNYIGNYA